MSKWERIPFEILDRKVFLLSIGDEAKEGRVYRVEFLAFDKSEEVRNGKTVAVHKLANADQYLEDLTNLVQKALNGDS